MNILEFLASNPPPGTLFSELSIRQQILGIVLAKMPFSTFNFSVEVVSLEKYSPKLCKNWYSHSLLRKDFENIRYKTQKLKDYTVFDKGTLNLRYE